MSPWSHRADSDGNPYEFDTPAAKRLEAFAKNAKPGSKRPMSAFTPFHWDSVWAFGETTDLRKIDEAIGKDFFGRDGSLEVQSLFVFMRDGEVVEAIAPLLAVEENGSFRRDDAVVRVTYRYNVEILRDPRTK